MARPLIALLTDFGLHDHYVGVMKGVMLGICPDAHLVDLSHDVPPQNILRGMLMLDAAVRYFPAGTVFLCVVDPGVGSSRRPLALDADGARFVGPDNGLLSRVYDRAARRRAVELTSASHALPVISRTFEGRDRFAPAAAWLARGVPLDALGPGVEGLVHVDWPEVQMTGGVLTGEVIAVDHFGNLVTSIEGVMLQALPAPLHVQIAGRIIMHVVNTYADAPPGSPCALVGSDGRLEIAVPHGSAAAHLGAAVGSVVQVRSIA